MKISFGNILVAASILAFVAIIVYASFFSPHRQVRECFRWNWPAYCEKVDTANGICYSQCDEQSDYPDEDCKIIDKLDCAGWVNVYVKRTLN